MDVRLQKKPEQSFWGAWTRMFSRNNKCDVEGSARNSFSIFQGGDGELVSAVETTETLLDTF